MARGMSAGRRGGMGGGGAGGRAGTSGGVGAGAMDAFDRNGDPAVTGNFEQNPQYRGRDFLDTLLGNAVTGGGKLTEHGQEQKADSDILKQGSKLYMDAKMQGASDQDAFHHALATLGAPLGLAMMMHPSHPLVSSAAAHQFLAGNTEHYGSITKEGQQVVTDDQGKAIRMEDVPGFRGAPTKTQFVPGAAQPMVMGPDGTAHPVLDAQGNPILGKTPPADAKAAALAATYTKGIDGLPDQPTAKTPLQSKAIDEKSIAFLREVDPVMNALKDIQAHADALGLVKGPVVLGAGKFLGINGQGIDLSADIDILKKNAPAMMGSVYGKSIDAFMNAVTGANDAPAFVRAQTNRLMDDIRGGAQTTADNITATRGPPLPQSIANQLIPHGIVPTGYQTREVFDQMGPAETARWKLQFAPNALTDNEYIAAVQAAKSGKFGPPPAPNTPPTSMQPDLSRLIGTSQKFRQQQQNQQQQGTANAVAGATNSPQKPPGNAMPPNPEIQPAEIAPAQPTAAGGGQNKPVGGYGPEARGVYIPPGGTQQRDIQSGQLVNPATSPQPEAAQAAPPPPPIPTQDSTAPGMPVQSAPPQGTEHEEGKVIPLAPVDKPDTPYTPNPVGQ